MHISVPRLFCLFAFVSGFLPLYAQVTLLEENFNQCALPAGWTAQSSGAAEFVWYVDVARNNLVAGQSIDTSCLLFIDDYAAPSHAGGYVLEFLSPTFDVRPYTRVDFSLDVHFRFGQGDFLQILVTDGLVEQELARFDAYRTNAAGNVADHFSSRYDLALVSQSANTRLIIRYTSPAGSAGKYAGIDNIAIIGSGAGVNLLREAFNFCTQPAGWQTERRAGDHDWRFGRVEPGSSAFFDGNSMDGSCFVYFDDAALGDTSAPSTVRLYSPWFDGDTFFRYELNFDLLLRYNGSEHIAVFLQTAGTADSIELFRRAGHVAGPFFPKYESFRFDLSTYRAPQLRLVFEYSDNGAWGYWAGLDNVKVTGSVPAHERCEQALPLLTGATCTPTDNRTAILDGPPAPCADAAAGSLWYHWTADFNGIAQVRGAADFNDVVQVFTGGCSNLQTLLCNNRDEHGFTGETTLFQAQAGAKYYLRLVGQNAGFGRARGNACVSVGPATTLPSPPPNDPCNAAIPLAVGAPCTAAGNRDAAMNPPQPTLNNRARADVWYAFTAGNLAPGQFYQLRVQANYSNIITLYRGACDSLLEMTANHRGNRLDLPALNPGQTYYLQIANNFATVEGDLCPEIRIEQQAPPANDSCLTATPVPLDGPCVPGNNLGAGFSGYRPPCAVSADRDIWFRFVAPAFGSVHINTGADFRHTLTVWDGSCNNLKPVFCALNPQRCDGYRTVGSLTAGQNYYLQIATWTDVVGPAAGNVCIRILDGAASLDFQPLELEITPICIGLDSSLLELSATGGTPPYTFTGYTAGQVLPANQPFAVAATDAAGCQTFETGAAPACPPDPCPNAARAAVQVFLQGPYSPAFQLMHDSLRRKNLIPLTEPYTGMTNFTHVGGGGEQIDPAILSVAGPNAIVDWVFLELRAAANPAQALATRSALLQRDGDVVDLDGNSPVRFELPGEQYYYIVVRHRNHLGVQTGAPVFFPTCTAAQIDFRTLPTQNHYAFNGQNPAQRLVSGKNVLWAGNGRPDFQLKYNGSNNDRTVLLNFVGLTTPNLVIAGYLPADYNMDGQVKYNGSANDRNVLLGNIGIATPLAIVHDQVGR